MGLSSMTLLMTLIQKRQEMPQKRHARKAENTGIMATMTLMTLMTLFQIPLGKRTAWDVKLSIYVKENMIALFLNKKGMVIVSEVYTEG